MEMNGEQLIGASQAEVWKALNDPETLKACVPGCEAIDRKSDTEYEVLMVARVGPVSAKFKGQLRLSDINPPESYSIEFSGQGGAAGFAKGGASVQLRPDASGTRLTYEAKAHVGGKLAQIGSRLVDMAARKTADDFFQRFKEKVSNPDRGGPASGEPHGAAHPGPVPPDPSAPTITTGSLMFFAAGSLVVLFVALITML